jgi:carbamoyl-phosphate synthase large subunit
LPSTRRCYAATQQATICQLTGYDPWFVAQIGEIAAFEQKLTTLDRATLRKAKRMGFSDRQLARVVNERVGSGEWREGEVLASQSLLPNLRISESPNLTSAAYAPTSASSPTYHQVDTCAAEFEAYTPYLYSSYESESEAAPTDRRKIMILGGGPNRIGQGIEFDYCCCHASFALQDLGYETIMVNCNPETVSTDYDTSDRLYFEPLTLEDVLNIVEREGELGELGDWGKEAVADAPISQSPLHGVIVQFGGQTPLNLAGALQAAGVPILGTTPDAIDLAEDRDRFGALLDELDISAPDHGSARTVEEAMAVAAQIGYPVVVRPSYVLGGRAMAIVDGETDLRRYMAEAVSVRRGQIGA